MWLVADVRDRNALQEAFKEIQRQSGRVDFVVSNAGVARHGPISEISPADIDVVVGTNLIGFFNLMALAVPALRRSGGGAVVAISSVHAVATSQLASVYAATKAGLVAAVRAMALDHAPDSIRVNAVLPGSVDTPMLRASANLRSPQDPEGAIRQWGAAHPIGRVLSPAEIADAIVFLLSPAASGITGAALAVYGGLTAKLAL